MAALKDIQKEILPWFMKIVFVIGSFAFIATLFEDYHNGHFVRFLSIYLPIYVLLALATFVRRIPGIAKVLILVVLLYCTGVSELIFFGYNSLGFFFLFSMTMIATLVYSKTLGWVTQFSSVFTICIVAALHLKGVFSSQMSNSWASPIILYSAFSFTTLYLVGLVLNHLGREIDRGEQMRTQLEEKQFHLETANEILKNMAYIDPVTGLGNSRMYESDIDGLSRLEKDTFELHVILIEMVEFEKYNLKYGTEGGDEIFKTVGMRLKGLKGYHVYRFNGASFILVSHPPFEGKNNPFAASALLEVLTEPHERQGDFFFTHFRGAVVHYPSDMRDLKRLNSGLVQTLMDDDSSFHDEIISYSEMSSQQVIRRNKLAERLDRAVGAKGLSVVIQPKLSLKTGQITGGELLLRWHDEELGDISPSEFIPIAEKNHQILPLTHLVMKEAGAFFNVLKEDRSTSFRTISVNISPLIVRTNHLSEFLCYRENLDENTAFDFELTEGAFLGSERVVKEELEQLHSQGIIISIDDFGTGYSNLEYLQDMSVDVLKIDRKFITRLPEDQKQINLVRAIVRMAKALNLRIIAEGIETEEQLNWLRDEGVDEIQGFYFARPMTLERFTSFFSSHQKAKWLPSSHS